MKITTTAGVAATICAVLVPAACSSTDLTTGPPTGPAPAVSSVPGPTQHNDADVGFVQGMIPHHSEAVDMARQVRAHAGSEPVRTFATRIEQVQGPEVAQMRGLLTAWAVPENAGTAMPGMSRGQRGGMAGMMTDAQMQQLGQARGDAFDRLFLQMMITHHAGAVEMARTELAVGVSPETKTLARSIIEAQQAEITEMQTLMICIPAACDEPAHAD